MTQTTAAPADPPRRETPAIGPTDHELMARCRSGDADALARIVARWQRGVARTLARLAPASDVDDLCQEVFVRVHQARDRYRPVGCFSTWLFTIVTNVGRDAARRTRRKPLSTWGDREPPLAAPSAPHDPEMRLGVQAALAALPPELREVVALRHFAELTFAETAAVLGLPVSTVKSRFQSALDKLAWDLRRRGFDPQESER